MMAEGSYVISDPKGNLADKYGPYLESLGYKVIRMDFIPPKKSFRYNPITRCRTTQDIMRLAHMLVYESRGNTGATSRSYDPFWEEVRHMLSGNDLDFCAIGQERTALFVQVSDTDRTMDALVNLFYSQIMNELCDYADTKCEGSRLPVPVQFILDDFATNARIDNFENIISNIRSRGISTMIMLQSEAQLRAAYGDSAATIVDNCNTYVYLGGSSPEQARSVAQCANKPSSQIPNMPLDKGWIFRRGEQPILCDVFDLNLFETELGFEYGQPTHSIPDDLDAID